MTDDLAARRSARAKAQQAELDRRIIARAAHIPGRQPDPDDGFANCCLAIVAVLKLGPGLVRDVAMNASRVLMRSSRPNTPDDWGEAVRHLRGWGELRETAVDGQTRWELGNCRPEVLVESWADPIARAVCAGRDP